MTAQAAQIETAELFVHLAWLIQIQCEILTEERCIYEQKEREKELSM